MLVFGPKVLRVLRGQGDQWDHRARVRGITASFSLNGIGQGLVPEDSPDLYQENEELKVILVLKCKLLKFPVIKIFIFPFIYVCALRIFRSTHILN